LPPQRKVSKRKRAQTHVVIHNAAAAPRRRESSFTFKDMAWRL
jgi:hypothetical protein